MSEINHPHDHFFRSAFARPEVAHDFLRFYLPPPVVALLDLTTLELRPDSYIDDDLREHCTDLLYQTRRHDGADAYVYLLFEHKSAPDSLVAFQLLRYMVRIWEQILREAPPPKLPPIIPLVIYHGRVRWNVAPDFDALLDGPADLHPYGPAFRYELYDLSQYRDEELVGAATLQVALQVLKYIFDDQLAQRLPAILALLTALSRQRSGLDYLYTVLRYVAQAGRTVTEDALRQAVRTVFAAEGEAMMTTVAEQWRERGKQEGLALGKQEGLAEGARQGLLAAIALGLELRFGDDGLALLPDIQAVSNLETIQALYTALKSVDSPDDLRRIYQPES
ncbi:MAG: Rpn family recombination-promoting nuclease/putative transposase [Chloroflexales bacterium]|nr:Rpn family recombination-promoting nuclease/putative transposase [Chloroflexales bacterium]